MPLSDPNALLRRTGLGDMELNLSDRHIVALNLLLVVVLSYFAALAVNDVIRLRRGTSDAPARLVEVKLTDDSSANRSRAAYQAIVERDIFNLVPPPAPAPEVVIEDLHLTLIGVSQTTSGKPFAIVADPTGQQSVYQVGETIPGAGKLLEVGKDRAVIEHGGKQVAIELPKDDMNGGTGALQTPSEANTDALAHRLARHRRRNE